MTSPAERWNAIYADATEPGEPADFVVQRATLLEGKRRAVDLAGGTGGTAIWLAGRGLDTTLVEVSAAAIDVAQTAASGAGVSLATLQHDLEADGLPEGSWDVAVVSNFLHRPLLADLVSVLAPEGLAFVRVATERNLERNEHPRAEFLVAEDELPELCVGLEVVEFEQGWFNERREARLVARRR